MPELSHFDDSGASRMIDVGQKKETIREAWASGIVVMQAKTLDLIKNQRLAKGDVFEVARLAGIMAAKKTPDLIPLCHPLPLTGVKIDFELLDDCRLKITGWVRVFGRTGVEMEALTAVSVAGLTIYDMCKSVDRFMTLTDIHLDRKEGGASGTIVRDPAQAEPNS